MGYRRNRVGLLLSDENKQAQKDSLARHIHASQHLKKPLIVHTREAKADTLDILQSEKAEHGIIHCFTEDWDTAKRALDLGFYISFFALSALKMLKPCEMWHASAQRPHPYRDRQPLSCPCAKTGQINEPAYVPYVAECLAGLFNDTSEVGELTTK